MRRYCLTLDLKNDPLLVEEYIKYHQNVWPEIQKSISDAGILAMEIYHVANRLFMIIEANESFSFEEKQKMDAGNPRVAEWENLMDQYQERLPFAKSNEKWVLMEKIFAL
jgi:L-rhamnose mutarotase